MADAAAVPSEEQEQSEAGARPWADQLLDLVVFGPVGVVVSAVEEFPRMAEVGRQSVDTRISSARAVGQFVCLAGGQELRRRAEGLRRRGSAEAEAPTRATPSGPPTQVVRESSVDVTSLAIPGYDTLSASQVVQRLDGLDVDQLTEVQTYERETRGRRTILARIEQLVTGASAAP